MRPFLGIFQVLFFGLLVSAAIANNATCDNPKVRREWRKLSVSERKDWIDAVNCLTTLPHDPKLTPSVPVNASLIPPINATSSFYDDLVYAHMDLNTRIHFTGLFLPWHRYYVQHFEDVLTNKCGFKGVQPYWDWTQDAHDFYNTKFLDNSSSGVGGWGDPVNDDQIFTGGFKDITVAYPTPHRIRRIFSLFPLATLQLSPPWGNDPSAPPPNKGFMINTTMTKQNVDFTVNNFEGDFFGFKDYLENTTTGSHITAHWILGGDMAGTCPNGTAPPACTPGPKWTPNDPLFFMHHAMIDKIWYDWQHKSPRNELAYGGGSVGPYANYATFSSFPSGLPPFLGFDSEIPGDGLWDGVQIWDVMDTTKGKLCYVYA